MYKAESVASNAEVVLKAYNLAGLSVFLRHQVLRELDIHSRLSHSGVVHLMAAFRVRARAMVQRYWLYLSTYGRPYNVCTGCISILSQVTC